MGQGMTSVGVFTTDRELTVRSWDPWIAEASGVSAAAACGVPLVELFPEIAARGFVARLSRVIEQGAVEVLAPAFHRYLVPCAPRAPSANFDHMQQHVTLSPLRAGGEIVGVAVTIEDVTARLDRERALAAALHSHDEAIRLRAAQTLADEEHPTPTLATALGDNSWRVRRAVARGMARATDEDAVIALVTAVRERHRDPAVLNAAIAALTETGAALTGVVELLRTGDADVRTYAALTLGLMDDPRALPPLIEALGDEDVNVRYHAIEALGRIGGRAAAEPIAAIAASRDFFLAFAALDALAVIGEPSVASYVVPLLDDEMLQAPAAEALGRSASEDVAAPLAQLLSRPGTDVAAVAGALATLYDRLERSYGEGELVADVARRTVGSDGAQNLLAALPTTGDAALRGLVMVLGWLDAEGIDSALARMLSHPVVRPVAAESLATRGTRALDALVDALASPDSLVRRAAAAALGRIANPRAVPALLDLLDDEAEVAIVALGALGAIGDHRAFEPLIGMLDHDGAAVRQAAVAALNSLGHPALPERTRALHVHESPRVRECAARIAAYFGYSECLGPLLTLARDPVEPVRRVAIEQLGLFDDDAAATAIAEALRKDTPDVRAAAARALAQVRTDAAVPTLRVASLDEDQWVRYHAARSAGRHRDRRLLDMLVRLASKDTAPPVRIAAARSLGELGADDATPALAALAGDPDVELACAALEALGRLHTIAGHPALTRALRSDVAQHRLTALGALAQLGEEASVSDVARLARNDPDPRVRDAAVVALGRIRTEPAVDALLALLDWPRRARAATDALAGGGEAQVPWVARGLALPDPGARCAVVEALARMKHPSASRRIVQALEDESAAVRLAAAQALSRLDLREAEQQLSAVARTDQNPAVRQAAHAALAR